MKKYVAIIIYVFNMVLNANAQEDWEKYYNGPDGIEDMEMENGESGDWEHVYDMLSDMAEHPFNVNTVTREELEQLPFLTDNEVEDICEYLYSYGGMKTLGELAMIESLDYEKRCLLKCFLYVGDKDKKKSFPTLKNIMKYGRHNVVLTGKVPLYERKGDKNGYRGYQYRHNIRYNFGYGDRVRLGIVGAQDAGEPFFANKNGAGYDFYSFYLTIKKLGCLKTLVLGKYRVGFGLGLVINNDFSLGKIATLTSLGRNTGNIRPHSSTQSGRYLQGAAATVELVKGLDLSAFVSYRGIDATMNKDTNTIATILTSGYHRTQTELEKKNNSKQKIAGGNIRYFFNGFHIGATVVYTAFDKDLQPKDAAIYRRYYASGNNFYNIGINYGYINGRISLDGETATGDCGALATINRASCRVSDRLDMMVMQRFYSKRYYALLARSFSEGGAVQDESGIYLGSTWRPLPGLSVMAYTDYSYFAWPKYQASSASYAWDNLVSVAYNPGCWNFMARYRYKMRERDRKNSPGMAYKREHRGRIYAMYAGGCWSNRAQTDVVFTHHEDDSFGWMVTDNLSFDSGGRFKLNGSIGYFHTKDYDSRVYSYERGMLYSFSFPSFYGKGIRGTLLVRADISRKIMVSGKLSFTDYFDRDHIGNGLQQINHSSATDVEMQLRLRL